jgi:hypothetical protein
VDYLKTVRQGETRQATDAERALYEGYLGVRGSGLYNALSHGLEILTSIASCRWGCRDREHHREHLIRRFVNASLASLRLSFAGYNDEAVATVRVTAETTNLLQLFDREPTRHMDWVELNDRERRRRFGPVKVRLALEECGAIPFFDEDAYGVLSSSGTHLSPDSVKASHDLECAQTFVGPMVSVPAMLMIWCELGYATTSLFSLGTVLSAVPESLNPQVVAIREIITSAVGKGELRIVNYQPGLAWFRTQLESGAIDSSSPIGQQVVAVGVGMDAAIASMNETRARLQDAGRGVGDA